MSTNSSEAMRVRAAMDRTSVVLIPDYPDAKIELPVPPTLFDSHPTPWAVGECNETRADICDANHRVVTSLRGGGVLGGASAYALAERFVALVNASR